MANGRPAGQNAGKLWIVIGLMVAVFGMGMTFMTNNVNEKRIDEMSKQCEKDGGEPIVSKEKSFLSTNYKFECE